MIPLLVVRPEPGASDTLAAARARGIEAHAFPIFAMRAVSWDPVARDAIDAVVLGSANALRHGGPAIADLRGLPAYCVGQATADAARAAGLEVVRAGSGGLQQVLALLDPSHRRLLRLAGAARVPLHLPPQVRMETRTVYESVALPMSEGLARMLQGAAVVMLHSGEAARHFDAICAAAAIDRSCIALAAIGPRVADVAGAGWAAVACAERPSDAALLALAGEMCQDPRKAL